MPPGPGTSSRLKPPRGYPRRQASAPDPGVALKPQQLQLRADWHFEVSEDRQHYVIEPWLDGRRVGRAYGWFEAGSCFVLEKIEVDRGSRSRGFGTAVIEQLRLKAREMGCR